jgi:hypothetical protein
MSVDKSIAAFIRPSRMWRPARFWSAPLGDWPVSGLGDRIPLAFPLDRAVALEEMGARFE